MMTNQPTTLEFALLRWHMPYTTSHQAFPPIFGSDAVADVTSHGEKKRMGRQITSKFTVISVISETSINVEAITNKTTSHIRQL